MLQNVKYIESLGGTIPHRFPPNVLIGNIPEGYQDNLTGHINIVEVATTAVDVSAYSKYGKNAEIAANAWNNNYKGKAAEKGLVSVPTPEPGPIIGDMLTLPENTKRGVGLTQLPNSQVNQALIQPYMAGFYDTSEYMIGDVAVGVIFLESNGSIDTDTEDWTTTEEYNAISEIQSSLNWWVARDPKAKLTFTYDIQYRVPTSYEPIARPANPSGTNGESLWIADAMSNLGYTKFQTYFDNVYGYENSIRKLDNADWAFTIFVIDSSNDSDGRFADNYIAYSYLGGPFIVENYKNDGYGISNMDAVVAHETGHIFYALDQYTSANSSCTETSGYLGIQNQNSAYPSPGACLSNVDSIMRGGISGYANGLIDAYARQQVGWRDTNANSILDIIDSFPSSILNAYSPDPTNDSTPAYTGSSTTILTYPNLNPYGQKHNITINKIANVQYRVDAGQWTNASPAEGLFDSSIEGFTFTVPQLSDGTHAIEVRALNTAGNWETTYANDTLTVYTLIDTMPPTVTNHNAIHEIPDDTDSEPLWGETAQLNVTVTDDSGVASVTVNLSEIGGSTAKQMINIGGNIWSITTNASAGTPPKLYNLTVNATDISGNSNTSVKIPLRVMKNGDCTGNGAVNIGDALRLANNVSFPGNPAYALSSPYVCEVTGNGVINIGDALRLANNVSYPGNPLYMLK
jgi:hypothetical protein